MKAFLNTALKFYVLLAVTCNTTKHMNPLIEYLFNIPTKCTRYNKYIFY